MEKKRRCERPASPPQRQHQKGALGRLDDLVDAVMMYPEIRKEKIRELQRAIANGEYEPTDRQIANAILADLQRRDDS